MHGLPIGIMGLLDGTTARNGWWGRVRVPRMTLLFCPMASIGRSYCMREEVGMLNAIPSEEVRNVRIASTTGHQKKIDEVIELHGGWPVK